MSAKLDTETLELPGAEVLNYSVHGGAHYVTVQFDSSCEQVPYIIGQFSGGGFSVLQVKFDENKIRFSKRV